MGSSPKLPKNYGGWNDFKSTGCDPEEGSRKDQDIGNAWNRFPWYLTQNLPRLWPAGFGELCILPHAATEAEPGGSHFVARWSHHSHGANWAATLTQSPCHGRFVASYPDLCWWLKVELPNRASPAAPALCCTSALCQHHVPSLRPHGCFCPAQRRPPLVVSNVLVEAENQRLISHHPIYTVKREIFPDIAALSSIPQHWKSAVPHRPAPLGWREALTFLLPPMWSPQKDCGAKYRENNSASTSETFMKIICRAKSLRLKATESQMMATEHWQPGLRWRKTMQRAGDLPQRGQGGKTLQHQALVWKYLAAFMFHPEG